MRLSHTVNKLKKKLIYSGSNLFWYFSFGTIQFAYVSLTSIQSTHIITEQFMMSVRTLAGRKSTETIALFQISETNLK